jgi:hypothetical protein
MSDMTSGRYLGLTETTAKELSILDLCVISSESERMIRAELAQLRAELATAQATVQAQAEAIRAARHQLRATSYNWREDCLFRADEILTKALGEEA